MTGELAERPKLVVLKAFTKTYAMAGLRLGYALCGDAAFAERLRQADQPWPVSHVAQEAGIAALQEIDYTPGTHNQGALPDAESPAGNGPAGDPGRGQLPAVLLQ